jgi:TolA-binding protein
MTEFLPFVFLILAAGLLGISMKMMLEYKKRAARFERENIAIRRRRDKHLAVIEENAAKAELMEGEIEKDQTRLTALQLQQRETTTRLTDLEATHERLHPASRKIETDREE